MGTNGRKEESERPQQTSKRLFRSLVLSLVRALLDMSRRGPKIGDAVSLWNFAPSPGFTKDEAHILKICLMALGVGRWVQILDTGLLSGKLTQQLNGQTQRLLGQQSLAAFTGLH